MCVQSITNLHGHNHPPLTQSKYALCLIFAIFIPHNNCAQKFQLYENCNNHHGLSVFLKKIELAVRVIDFMSMQLAPTKEIQ